MKFKRSLRFLKAVSLYSLIFVTVFLSAFSAGLPQKVDAQAGPSEIPINRFWSVGGPTFTTVLSSVYSSDEERVYIGGNFTQISTNPSNSLIFDAYTDTESFDTENPEVTGEVLASIPDGLGGWYIGGDFTDVGGVARNRLAHILPNNSIDLNFNPGANGQVLVLLLNQASNTLYVGGAFTSLGGQTRNRLAAINTSTGQPASWNPDSNNIVRALALNSADNTLYVGGDFTSVGGQTRNRLAAINTSNGSATSWNPNSNNVINALVLNPTNGTLYAGGSFTSIGGQTRNRLAAVSPSTGLATSWNPNANGPVLSLAFKSSTNVLYVGGSFGTIGGGPRNNLAAVNISTGLATSWYPNMGGTVTSLVINPTNEIIYVGGSFTSVGGNTSFKTLVAISTVFGLPYPWDTNIENGTLKTIALDAVNNEIYVGGSGLQVIISRQNLAAFNTVTGQPTALSLILSGTKVLALDDDNNILYLGGSFAYVNGTSRPGLAAIDTENEILLPWNPGSPSSIIVNALALNQASNTLYVGGNFTSVGGQARNGLAEIYTTTGLATSWNPEGASASALALDSTNHILYIGGFFTSIGGQTRNKLAAIDTVTGQPTSWNPDVGGDGFNGVLSLALNSTRDVLYAGGYFTSVGGQSRNKLVAVNTTTGQPTSWNPNVAGSHVNAITLSPSDNTLYVGGSFTSVGGQTRNKLAAVNVTTGQPTSWNPDVGTGGVQDAVSSLTFNSSGGILFAGGIFTAVGGLPVTGFAAFDMGDPGPACAADFDNNGTAEVADIFSFLSAWFAGNLTADANDNGTIAVDDIFAFLSAWFAGC